MTTTADTPFPWELQVYSALGAYLARYELCDIDEAALREELANHFGLDPDEILLVSDIPGDPTRTLVMNPREPRVALGYFLLRFVPEGDYPRGYL